MKTSIKAEFKVFNTNGKGQTSIGLVLKGDLDDQQILALHRLKAEGVVFADLFNGQADMEDYAHDDVTSEGPHKGVAYSVDQDGSVNVPDDQQITFDKEMQGLDVNMPYWNKETKITDELLAVSESIQAEEEAHEKEAMPDDLPF